MSLLRAPLSLFTLTWQSAALALGQIWANKVRAVLTTIGIVIGVASVTAVIAALSGLKANVLTEFEAIGTNKIFISPDWSQFSDGQRWKDVTIRPKELEGLLDHCPSVKSFTRQVQRSESVTYGTRTEKQVEVMGIDPAWHDIENRNITLGRKFDHLDNEKGGAVCLVDVKAIPALDLPPDPTGKTLMIGDRRFRIIGVLQSRTDSGMFGQQKATFEVFIPLMTALQLERFPQIFVVAISRTPEVNEDAQAELKFFLRRSRRIPLGQPDNFRVEAIQQFLDQFKSVAAAITVVATGVVGISLLVGGVGIMNIMLVSVSERTREIGLRKAVGARPGAILLQFLIEAVMICLMGGLIGLLIGQGLTMLMAKIPAAKLENATIPPWAVGLSFGFAAATGLVFGMFPAIKAARLDPIDALRHE